MLMLHKDPELSNTRLKSSCILSWSLTKSATDDLVYSNSGRAITSVDRERKLRFAN